MTMDFFVSVRMCDVYSLHCNLFHPKNLLQESLKCVNNKIIQLQK